MDLIPREDVDAMLQQCCLSVASHTGRHYSLNAPEMDLARIMLMANMQMSLHHMRAVAQQVAEDEFSPKIDEIKRREDRIEQLASNICESATAIAEMQQEVRLAALSLDEYSRRVDAQEDLLHAGSEMLAQMNMTMKALNAALSKFGMQVMLTPVPRQP